MFRHPREKQMSAPTSVKIVLVGDGAVGKTSLLTCFAKDVFPEEHVPTVFDNDNKDIMLDGKVVQLSLWDTAGQEDYRRLRPLSYPSTDVFIICFDCSDSVSFAHVSSSWLPEIRHYSPGTPFVVVCNKADLRLNKDKEYTLKSRGQEFVTREEAKALASKIGASAYVECSARTREGLEEVFAQAARVAVAGRERAANSSASKRGRKATTTAGSTSPDAASSPQSKPPKRCAIL